MWSQPWVAETFPASGAATGPAPSCIVSVAGSASAARRTSTKRLSPSTRSCQRGLSTSTSSGQGWRSSRREGGAAQRIRHRHVGVVAEPAERPSHAAELAARAVGVPRGAVGGGVRQPALDRGHVVTAASGQHGDPACDAIEAGLVGARIRRTRRHGAEEHEDESDAHALRRTTSDGFVSRRDAPLRPVGREVL